MCVASHHSLLLKYNLSCSEQSLQSVFISARPKISNLYFVIPLLISSSLSLFLLNVNPPIFWNPMHKIFLFFFFIKSPKVSLLSSKHRVPLDSSLPRSREESLLYSGTGASSSLGTAGFSRLIKVVG